jgi:hypothetical protein
MGWVCFVCIRPPDPEKVGEIVLKQLLEEESNDAELERPDDIR